MMSYAFNGSKEREIIMFTTVNTANVIETVINKVFAMIQAIFSENRDALTDVVIESSSETDTKPFEGLL